MQRIKQTVVTIKKNAYKSMVKIFFSNIKII